MIKKVVIILGIATCLFLIIDRYRLESRKLCRSEEVVIRTENYLMELSGFLYKIARMNSDLRKIFCRNLMAKDLERREFDSKLSEIFLELTKEKARLDKTLIHLRVYYSDKRWRCDRWWIIKSQKKRYLANQRAIDFYTSGLKVVKCQFCDVIGWLNRYRATVSNNIVMAVKVDKVES